jgi:hypothetical protein
MSPKEQSKKVYQCIFTNIKKLIKNILLKNKVLTFIITKNLFKKEELMIDFLEIVDYKILIFRKFQWDI